MQPYGGESAPVRANVLDLSMYRQLPHASSAATATLTRPTLGGAMMDGIRPKSLATPLPISAPQVAEAAPPVVRDALRWRWISMGMVATSLALSAVIAHNIYMQRHASSHPSSVAAVRPVTPAQLASQQALAQQTKLNQTLGVAIGANPISAVVTNLKTGQTSSINGGQQMVSASLYKLFVAMAVFKQIDAGGLTLTAGVPGSGGQNVASCLRAMITVSDNTCGVALGTLVGWERQNADLRSLGFISTALSTNSSEVTSADDVALFYKMLYNGTLLSPFSSSQLLDLLKNQRINNRVPAGLPAGTVVAHKTGDLDGLVHDAGIVYSPGGDYVISLMSGPWSNINDAAPALSNISAQIYQTLNTPAGQ